MTRLLDNSGGRVTVWVDNEPGVSTVPRRPTEPTAAALEALEDERFAHDSSKDMSGDASLNDRYNQTDRDLTALADCILSLRDDAAALHDAGELDDDFYDQLLDLFGQAEVTCG